MNKQLEDLVDLMFDTNMEEVMKEKSTLEYINKLQQENKQLKEDKKKAIECIKNRNTTKSKKERFMSGETTIEKVLKILGDKENE